MKKTCTVSGKEFEITPEEIKRRKELDVPLPTLCPTERMRQRLIFRNEHSLFRRKCDGTDKTVISLYPPEFKTPVYDNEYWWSDNWDAKRFGQDFDFSKPFFEQFEKLWRNVPKMARLQQGTIENSTFTNAVSNLKNCYLVFSTNSAEDCLYCLNADYNRDCVDCFFVFKSELLYECTDSSECYSCTHGQRIRTCTETHWSSDCVGCQNCFACVGLRKKEFHILNKPCTREEWKSLIEDPKKQQEILKNLRKIYLDTPRKHAEMLHCEDCTGDLLLHSQRAHSCWDGFDLEDCLYCDGLRNAKNCLDVSYYGCSRENVGLFNCEAVGHGASDIMCSKLIWGGSNSVAYSYECFASHDLFGCCGLRHAEYCIFNKQYTKEEYFKLREKIVSHMKKSDEWGEFFPSEMSPFCYNDTMANDFLPLTKEAVVKKGWLWREKEKSALYNGPVVKIPLTIQETNDNICDKILTCEATGTNYRVQKAELKFYRKMNIPIPTICPNERYRLRIATRNPRNLWTRKCDHCNKEIQTTFAPDRPETVYCETCYLNEIN